MSGWRKWKVHFDESTLHAENKHIPDPPGYVPGALRELEASSSSVSRKGGSQMSLKQQALYSRAGQSVKNVGFMCFMQWMSGNSLQIFSIMMVASGLYQPLASIMTVAKAFPKDPEGKLEVLGPRLLFCVIQLGGLLFTLWKLNGMGLLPTHVSDWVSSTAVPRPIEFAAPAIPM